MLPIQEITGRRQTILQMRYLETRKASYAAQRAASQGAGITLVSHAGEYVASFDCARHCAEVLGSRNEWVESTILGSTPIHLYCIPLAEMHSALLKLSARFSVALSNWSRRRKARALCSCGRYRRTGPHNLTRWQRPHGLTTSFSPPPPNQNLAP